MHCNNPSAILLVHFAKCYVVLCCVVCLLKLQLMNRGVRIRQRHLENVVFRHNLNAHFLVNDRMKEYTLSSHIERYIKYGCPYGILIPQYVFFKIYSTEKNSPFCLQLPNTTYFIGYHQVFVQLANVCARVSYQKYIPFFVVQYFDASSSLNKRGTQGQKSKYWATKKWNIFLHISFL